MENVTLPDFVEELKVYENFQQGKEEAQLPGKFIEDAEGNKIYYKQFGNENAPQTLLCLHGITWWSFSYDYLVTQLVKGGLFRIITFDFFGRGFSGSPNKKYNVDTYLAQIETVVEKLSLTKFTLIGSSMGGLLATYFARKHPQQVESLVLLAPAIPPANLPFLARLLTVPYLGSFLFHAVGPTAMLNKLRSDRCKDDFYDTSRNPKLIDGIIQRVEWVITSKPGSMGFCDIFYSTFCNLPFNTGSWDVYEEVVGKNKMRTLLIVGKYDKTIPISNLDEYRRRAPDVKVVELDNTGHALVYEQPDRLRDAILEFLSQ